MKVSRVQALILWWIPLSLAACNMHRENPRDKAHPITVAAVQSKTVTLTQQYVCQIQAHHHIKIRAPESGMIEAIQMGEGQMVKQDDLLFQIRPSIDKEKPYEKSKSLEDLLKSKIIVGLPAPLLPAGEEKGDANTENALVPVKAPFSGMVARLTHQQGSLVLKGETLTTLSDNSLMWVYFNVPEARYLQYKSADIEQHKDDLKIELLLANGNKFDQPGKLAAIGNDFHKETGSIRFRADFPNPDGLLRRGQTGTIVISQVQHDAIVIPQRATFEVRQQRYVFVIDQDEIAHQREIIIQNELDDQFVVKSGVSAGDRIVIEGVKLVHDGDKMEHVDRPLKKVVAK